MKKEGKMSEYTEIKRRHKSYKKGSEYYNTVETLIDIIEKYREGFLEIDQIRRNKYTITKSAVARAIMLETKAIVEKMLKLTEE